MKNSYLEMKERQQAEVNAFPMEFAFTEEQFAKGMRKLGLSPDDTDKVFVLKGTGGFYCRSDSAKLHEMFDRHHKEMNAAIAADRTGDGFIYDMFLYELGDHEYGYTRDVEETLDSLGLTVETINANPRLRYGLDKALKQF